MAYLGMIIGSIFAMLLGGHLAAWIIRKVVQLRNTASYAIGVSLMTFVGAWSITYPKGPSFLENWIPYVIGAAIAFPLMIAGDRRKRRKAA